MGELGNHLEVPLLEAEGQGENETVFAPLHGAVKIPVSLPGKKEALDSSWVEFSVLAISLSQSQQEGPKVLSSRLRPKQRPRLLAFAPEHHTVEFDVCAAASMDSKAMGGVISKISEEGESGSSDEGGDDVSRYLSTFLIGAK